MPRQKKRKFEDRMAAFGFILYSVCNCDGVYTEKYKLASKSTTKVHVQVNRKYFFAKSGRIYTHRGTTEGIDAVLKQISDVKELA